MSLLFLLLVLAAGAQAQGDITKSLERNVPGQGKVTVYQDPRIAALLGSVPPSTGEQKMLESSEYRVQTYAGNNTRRAKNEAHNVSSRVKKYSPELSVCTSLNPPHQLCKVGDFRSIEEADAVMRELEATGVFEKVSVVKDQINVPL